MAAWCVRYMGLHVFSCLAFGRITSPLHNAYVFAIHIIHDMRGFYCHGVSVHNSTRLIDQTDVVCTTNAPS